MPSDNWEIEVTMRVNGRGRIGADGMAVWYTDKVGTEGPVFGSNDNWNGLGIFLDSFDNDAQVKRMFDTLFHKLQWWQSKPF
jgi:mannose-binding lectin 1